MSTIMTSNCTGCSTLRILATPTSRRCHSRLTLRSQITRARSKSFTTTQSPSSLEMKRKKRSQPRQSTCIHSRTRKEFSLTEKNNMYPYSGSVRKKERVLQTGHQPRARLSLRTRPKWNKRKFSRCNSNSPS